MAKCIQNVKSDKVKRVSNQEANEQVDSGKWKYIGKSIYKRLLVNGKESK
jgi:hypothetical protein